LEPDELLTFAEAAVLHFPNGPFKATTLRLAGKRGELRTVRIADRTFTTGTAIAEMLAPISLISSPQVSTSELSSSTKSPAANLKEWSAELNRAIAPATAKSQSKHLGETL